MWWKSFAKAGALLAALIVAACTVTYDDPPNRPRPPSQSYCPRHYDPVCARRGNDRETFNNACLAEEAGYRVVRPGQCRRDDDDRSCPRIYDPVCARRDGQLRVFSNECEAESAGWRVVADQACQGSPPPQPQPPAPPPPPPPPAPPPPAGACDGYKPVCGIRGAQYQTFANICALQGSGFQFVMQGECGGLEQKP